MIRSLIGLNSSLQMTTKRPVRKYLSYVIGELITRTMPRWYVKKFMSFNHLKPATSKPYLTISFDCDLEEDIQAYSDLVAILGKQSIKASFAIVGKWVEQYPEEHKLLLREGHEIMNHTFTHPDNPYFNPNKRFNELRYEEQKREIQECDEVCRGLLNYRPVGFRTPHFGSLHTHSVYPILSELNYKYSSSIVATRTKNFGMPYNENSITEFPLSPCPIYPFSCLQTWALYRAPRKQYRNEREFLELFKEIIRLGQKSGAYLNFYFDPMDVVKMEYFEEMLSLIKGFTILPYRQIMAELDKQGQRQEGQ